MTGVKRATPELELSLEVVRSLCSISEAGCWIPNKRPLGNGYYQWERGGRAARRVGYSHRVAYAAKHGAIPDGAVIDHTCKNPACCNPDHLEAVTNAVNVRRGGKSVLTVDDVAKIKAGKEAGRTLAEMEAEFGVDRAHIGRIVRGKRWSAA